MITLQDYITACDYPGRLDEARVHAALTDYLRALGVNKTVRRLPRGWQLEDHPSIAENVDFIMDKVRVTIDASDARDARAASVASDARAALHARAALDARDARDAIDAIDASDAIDAIDAIDASIASDASDARAARDASAALDARAASVASVASVARAARVASDAIDALDARAAIDASAASAARAARAARDASVASVARGARVALAASAASAASKSLASWVILRGGYWSFWDLSWLSTTAFGARQTSKSDVSKWTEPLLEAHVAGAWLLHWTEDTLYWVAKPTLHLADDRRLHRMDGPAFECDVEDLYFVQGTLVPAEWVTDKASLDARTAITWPNLEQRRIACSLIVGWSKILADLDATVIDADGDPQIGTLVECKLPDLDRPARFLRVLCGTGREFAIGVPPDITSALAAQAWAVQLTSESFFRPEVRT